MMRMNSKKRAMRPWVLDFNLCSRWEEKIGWEQPDALIDHLVLAFFENDPYYPLPLQELGVERKLWAVFREVYLIKADQIMNARGKDGRLRELPMKFIKGCVAREKNNLADGLGHGHRNHND